MNILRVAISFLLLFFVSSTWYSNEARGQYEWARKMFKEFNHDFGTVVKGEDAEYRFQVENIFEEDMKIESVSSSCGCTQATATKNVLKTWEKAEIVAKFNTVAFDGARQARISVVFSRPYYAVVYLDVKGLIRTDTTINPGSVNFGTITDLKQSSRTINLTRFGNRNWAIKDIKSTYPHVKVTLKEVERSVNRVSYQITASLRDSAPVGFVQSELIIFATDDGRNELKFPIPMLGNISSPLQVTPQVLNIANIAPGEIVTKKIILKAEQPFTLVDVTCPNKSFRVTADQNSKSVHIVQVQYTAGESGHENVEADLTFMTNLPTQNSVKLKAIVSINGSK